MRKLIIFYSLLLISYYTSAQSDTTQKLGTLEEVVLTANKTATPLGNVAVPVQIIQQKTIQQNGNLRLKDILQEQAGLFITNGFGAGVQMQGLNPDYTLILLDGEPLVGRTAGVLDLNRISIGNIKKIEIVKGPSSSLYGSEAMAGVINIITEQGSGRNLEVGWRYGFGNPDKGWSWPIGKNVFAQNDLNIKGRFQYGKTGFQFSTDAYYVDGLSYRPYSTQRLPQPIWRVTQQFNTQTNLSKKTQLSFNLRYAYDYIKQEFAVNNNGNVSASFGNEINTDLNIIGNLSHIFKNKHKTQLKIYATHYNGKQQLSFTNKPDSQYIDQFNQQLFRIENHTDFVSRKLKTSLGAGYTIDQANSTRYDNYNNRKSNSIFYGYAQSEWKPLEQLTIIGGVRYDHNQLFAGAFSPKLAARYNINHRVSLLGSVGRGFKAPDFRQLYLNFTNNAAGGYTVFGSVDAIKIINAMQSSGIIADIKPDFNLLSQLKPEFSTGINAGIDINIDKKWKSALNFFRNDISNLIDVRLVAIKTNGAQIFSYINIKKAYTQGLSLNLEGQINSKINISSGYQFLLSADKDELLQVSAGKIYTRNADGSSRPLQKKEYAGLPNRSKHMASVRISYETSKKTYANLRLNYRSRWYVADTDGNGVYNLQDESASGFITINIAGGMNLTEKTTIYGGMDNITNYGDFNYLPNLQGRNIYAGIKIKIK